jgi:hypothetical protein
MLALKYLLMILGVVLCGSAGALVVYDVYISEQLRRLLARRTTGETGGETGITARRHRTAASASRKPQNEVLIAQAREGLNIGSAVSVRYRLDPRRLDTIPAKSATEITTLLPMIQRIPMDRRQFRQPARYSGLRRGSR